MRISEAGEILSESCVNVNSQHPHTELNVMLRNNMYILPSATLIRKSAFLHVGGFDTALQGYEDDDLFLRMFLNGYSNVFTQEVVSAWTINTKSTSFSEEMSRSRYLYFSKLLALFPLGTDPGDKVFADSLFPRFADKFAEDVIESALSITAVFKERQGRLRSFRRLLKSAKGVRTKNTYLLVTFPLAGFTQGPLRGLLRAVLLFAPLFRVFKVRLLEEFSARYSLEKKASDD
jgi:GT2 family glycosyltransferase